MVFNEPYLDHFLNVNVHTISYAIKFNNSQSEGVVAIDLDASWTYFNDVLSTFQGFSTFFLLDFDQNIIVHSNHDPYKDKHSFYELEFGYYDGSEYLLNETEI